MSPTVDIIINRQVNSEINLLKITLTLITLTSIKASIRINAGDNCAVCLDLTDIYEKVYFFGIPLSKIHENNFTTLF